MSGENLALVERNLVQARGYTVSAISGLLTVVAADGHVFGLRNVATDVEGVPGVLGSRAVNEALVVSSVRVRFACSTAFGSAQAMILRGYKVRGFTAIHTTGGTAVRAHYKRPNQVPGAASFRAPLTDISAYMSDTGAITGQTLTAQTALEPEFVAVGAGSTLPGVYEDWEPGSLALPHALQPNEGILFDMGLTMGATGVGRLFIDVECHRPNL
jgi:hypothetical protein